MMKEKKKVWELLEERMFLEYLDPESSKCHLQIVDQMLHATILSYTAHSQKYVDSWALHPYVIAEHGL